MLNTDVSAYVKKIMHGENGHGIDHMERVNALAIEFAINEGADTHIVALASWLHDVDDYKLFGINNANKLCNTRHILDEIGADEDTKVKVLDIVSSIGYNKRLSGIKPSSLEGMVVSDADMCDALGAVGILRTYSYGLSKGKVFFNKNISPKSTLSSQHDYMNRASEHSIQHFFDKLLLLPKYMLTNSGKREGLKRYKIMVHFLRELFIEEQTIT